MNKAKVSFLAGMLAITVFVSGCSKEGGMMGGGKVATVNGTTISKAEYDKTYQDFQKNFHLDTASMPPEQKSMMEDYLKQMTLNKLILETLIENEAKKDGIQVSDADVKAYKQTKIFSNPELKSQFQTFLSQNKMSESDFDAMLKENMLLNKFMEAKGGQAVMVTDSEVKTFYDKNVNQFKVPEQIHAEHILVKAIVPQIKQELRSKNPKITDAEMQKDITAQKETSKAKADKLFGEVKANPGKFEEIAKKNSEDTVSAEKGGDLGYMAESTIDPMFWAAAEKTPKGQLYPGVVESQFGYHIIKVLDRKEPHQQTFEEAKDSIREHMAQQKKQAFLQQWAQQQKSIAKINVEPAYQPKQAAQEAQPGAAVGGQAIPAPQVAPQQPTATAPTSESKH